MRVLALNPRAALGGGLDRIAAALGVEHEHLDEDITVERARAQVVRIVGSGEEVTSGQVPFTARAKTREERTYKAR